MTGDSAPASSGPKHPHFRNRRYSSKADREEANASAAATSTETSNATEEDGWISVGPKTHHPRKSFNHDDNGHRKHFRDYNRVNRGSFSKFGNNGSTLSAASASGNGAGARKKSFASNKPTKAELTAALNGTGDYHFNKPALSNDNNDTKAPASAVSSDENEEPKKENSSGKSVKPAPEIQVS